MVRADAPRNAAGYMSDQFLYGATGQDLMESVPALAWPESIRTYHAMRFDPKIAGVLAAYTLPLRDADWVLNPKGCRDEVVEWCAGALGLDILGDDSGPGPFVRRGVQWDDHLRLALLHLIYGFMPFAFAGEWVGDPMRYKLTTLAERMPQTITRIDVNRDGSLNEIYQFGEQNGIPASQLVWYVHNREGANWVGQSMLRPAYPPWLIKHEMWRVMATSSRRFGMGVPTVEAPPGGTPAQVTEAARLAASMRVGDQAGMGLPSGFIAKLIGITGSVPDTLDFTRYLDQQIAESVLAGLLNLDASPNGSRALGETMLGLLRMSWGATAREIILPANHLLADIVDWSWGEDEPVPSIQCINLAKPELTAEALKLLMDAGAVKYDPALEAAARDLHQLPPIDEEYRAQQPTPPTGPPGQPNPATPPENVPGTTGQPQPNPAPAGV